MTLERASSAVAPSEAAVDAPAPAWRRKARLLLALRAELAFGARDVPGVRVVGPEASAPPIGAPSRVEPALARRSQHADDAPRVAAGRSAAGGSSPSPRARPAQRDFFATAADPAAPAHAATTEEAATPFDAPPPSRLRRIELLQSLERDEVASCTRCQLHATRTQTVFGEGSPEARLMFIGEGPGENEDLQGRPFVGRAGQLLDRMISAMGLARPEVYIANVVKCRPPGNRVPTPVEVATCTGFLHRQIEWIRPQVIVTLGLPAARHLLRTNRTMGQMRGQWHEWRGIRVMPTYHPAFLLRSYTEQNRRLVWEDLRAVMRELGQGGPDGGEG